MKPLILLTLCLLTIRGFAQNGTYTAKDGTSVNIDILDANPDNVRHASVNLGVYAMDGARFFQANYYVPKLFYINGSIGEKCFMVDGNLFLINILKRRNERAIAKDDGQTRYIVRLPLEKRISIGAHTGFGSTDYSTDFNSSAHLPFSSKYAIAGLTFFKARHLNYVVDDERELKAHLITRLNLDAVFYFDRKIKEGSDETRTIDELSRKIGVRLYYEGRNSFYSRGGRMGFSYILGGGLSGDNTEKYSIFFGVGLFYAFL